MRTRSQTAAALEAILDLPAEIFTILEAYLEIRGIASCVLTCRTLKQRLERFLYKKVFITPRSYNTDTRHFVILLKRRPEIVHWIHSLIIWEYDVVYLPQLLAFTFPNLLNLIVQHEGPVASPLYGRSKLNALDAMVKPQPALQNLAFSIEQKLNMPPFHPVSYRLPASASTLLRHINLVRARLSFLDLTAFDHLPADYFWHSKLRELMLERCRYSAKNLQLLVNPCKSLNKLWLYQDPHPLYVQTKLPSILHPVKDTLRVLKSIWGFTTPIPEEPMNLREFPNLHAIIMHPKLLFGKRYRTVPRQELVELIKATLPPNLMILTLEGVVPASSVMVPEDFDWERGDRLGPPHDHYEGPFQLGEANRNAPSPDVPIPEHDLYLMKILLEEKEQLAPKLEWLTVQYVEQMKGFPVVLLDLAKEKRVKCYQFNQHEDVMPPRDMSSYVQGYLFEEKESGEGCLRGDGTYQHSER